MQLESSHCWRRIRMQPSFSLTTKMQACIGLPWKPWHCFQRTRELDTQQRLSSSAGDSSRYCSFHPGAFRKRTCVRLDGHSSGG